MEISFCDRCHESIPDVDLESGKAVRVGGKVLHVPCAFRRAMPGRGRSFLALLTLLALAGAAYSVVRLSRRDGDGGREFETRWRADDEASAARSVAALRKDADELRAKLQQEIDAGLETVSKQAGASHASTASTVAAVEGRLGAYREESDRMAKRIDEIDRRIEKISAWVEEVRNIATRSAAQPPPAPTPRAEPTAPTPTPPQPVASAPKPAVDPKVAAEHEAELRKWIEKLKDPDPSTRFSATYKLMDLNDLKAVAPLVDTLKGDKDYYTRLGAASALGKLHACDGVAALLDALDDKEELVQTAAADALLSITGHDVKYVPGLTKKERKTKREEWAKFWKDNEPATRSRLGQEKPAGEPAPR